MWQVSKLLRDGAGAKSILTALLCWILGVILKTPDIREKQLAPLIVLWDVKKEIRTFAKKAEVKLTVFLMIILARFLLVTKPRAGFVRVMKLKVRE